MSFCLACFCMEQKAIQYSQNNNNKLSLNTVSSIFSIKRSLPSIPHFAFRPHKASEH